MPRINTTMSWQNLTVNTGDFIQNQGSYGAYICADGSSNPANSIRLGSGDRTM